MSVKAAPSRPVALYAEGWGSGVSLYLCGFFDLEVARKKAQTMAASGCEVAIWKEITPEAAPRTIPAFVRPGVRYIV